MENCQQEELATPLYKPCLQNNGRGCGDVGNNSGSLNRDSLQGVEFVTVDQCQKIPEMDDSQLVGNADVAVRGDGGATVETGAGDGVKVVEMSAGKRRRGRPQRNQPRIMSSPAPPPQRKNKDEEDVCFICFDGGSLVLCDRWGCPKAYHPACIKRDEAFFKSKAKWNCGWHICSTCQKASYYMCYTCTYSLCKNCTKDADYVNVRGNKGFCGMCMRTIMLIENIALENKEMVQVDFDDKTSWEYLFKVYWIFLKEKLSLSLDELTKAKNPWKEIVIMGPKGESSDELNNGSNARSGNVEKLFGDQGPSYSKRRKTMKQQRFLNKVESLEAEKSGVMKGMPLAEGTNWATKELLEFVAHMKNGTSKVAEPYKIGERTIDVMLEILNLDKKEVVLIDGISNQEFSEDECQQLRQSIKCGQIKWFTVGEIQEKAMALQAARVNDWLGSEILRVNNLCDRASEKGHTKELRECVEKLQLLNSPDGRHYRLHEIPDVHSEPNMNLYLYRKCEEVGGELDEKKKENNMKPSNSGFGIKEKEPSSPLNGGDFLSDIGSRETSIPPHSTGMELSVNNIKTDKIWHYQDPLGKTQGPFTMAMLRVWSMSGLFPLDLRIWRVSEKQDNSILLTDALDGLYSQVQQLFHNSCIPTEDVRIASVGDVRSRDLNVNQMESKQVEGSLKSMQNDTSGQCCGNNESVKSKELGSQSSSTASVDIVNCNAGQMGSPLPHWDSVKGDNYFHGRPQVSSSLPSSTLSGKHCETHSNQVSKGHGVERWDCGSIDMNETLNKTSEGQIIAGNMKQYDSEGKLGKSCGQSWRSPPLNDASNGWDSNSALISLARALEASEHNQDIDFPDLPTSTSKLNHEDSKGQAKSKQSLSSNFPHQDSGPSWSSASSLVGNGSQLPEVAGEWGRYSSTPAKPFVKEWNSDFVPESSLKPTDLGSDHAATPTSGSGQLTHSSPTDPANNASAWDAIVREPNEYSLGDESVSDLLAEVEAMESLNGLATPTSILHCDGELAQGSEADCFSPVGGLSPAPDPGKGDALSSTNDLHMPSQSTVSVTNYPFRVSQSEVHDFHKSSSGHSSTSVEMDEDTRPSDVSVNQYESVSDMQPPAPPVTTWGMATADTAWRAGPETTGTNWGAFQGNANFNWGGLGQGTTNISWETGQGTFQENGSISSGTYAGNPPY
ncbi:zinc finger CCCH domain-containing protein 44-like isoform X2 [Durio zibethinus]|uniref:Zinc finger CCCH domain-containing protein 44-like isoform X2 n=1 Tax=Durio zibethinus TaxID=66656 RepID=A0A6P6BE62_DURZI|nr:zinc finger CCCH domain-containing protein 44-like isoform X2 [Durio zibethinus]